MRGLLAPLIKLVAFLLVTFAATYVLAATIANTAYGSTKTYHAMFTDTEGLSHGDDVRIAGVRVGTISGIKLVRNHADNDKWESRITFTVVSTRSLPTSTIATLRYRNLVGQRYLDLAQGAGDANDIMAAGSTIPVTQTHPALDL